MAIDTVNEKLALINQGMPFHPPLPVSPSTLGQDDQQQLLWGYPGILWGDFVPPPVVEPTVTPGSGGRAVRRKQELWSLTLDGKPYVFSSLDDLIAFLDAQEEKKVESTEEKAEKDAHRIVLVGREKAKPAPPKVRITSPVAEIKEYVDDVQAKIDRIYWKALAAALAREAEEEADIKFIAGLDL